MPTVTRTNLCQNPSAEINSVGYDPYFATATVVRTNATARTGSWCIQVTRSDAGASGMDGDLSGGTLVVGQTYTLSGYVKAAVGTPSVYAQEAYSGATGTTVTTNSSTWTRVSVTFVAASSGATYARSRFMFASGAVGDAFYLDNVMIEQTPDVDAYFDGSLYEGLGTVTSQSWSGTAQSSSSTITVNIPVVGRSFTKRNGAWRNNAYRAMVSGSWKKIRKVYGKTGGAWKLSYLAGGAHYEDTFDNPTGWTGFGDVCRSVVVQSTGKIVIGGLFRSYNGTTANAIIRFNSDWTVDNTFAIGTGFDDPSNIIPEAYNMVLQPDDKILIGGFDLYSLNGVSVTRLVRLNADGSPDTAFNANVNVGGGFNNAVRNLARGSDGKVVVVGSFTSYAGAATNYIMRFNSDGTPDTAFRTNIGTGFNDLVRCVAVQSDGKIICGGDFDTFNGADARRLVRLNSDGTLDTAFLTAGGTGVSITGDPWIYSVLVQADGKILACADTSSTSFNGTTVRYLFRLNADGSLDTAFTTTAGTGTNSYLYRMVQQSDGKVVLAGNHTTYNGTTVNYFSRINTDGSRDTTFVTNETAQAYEGAQGLSTTAYGAAVQGDGKVIVVGNFDYFNNQYVNFAARVTSTKGFDQPNITNHLGLSGMGIAAATQSDGKVIVGGTFGKYQSTLTRRLIRFNNDFTVDTAFTTNVNALGVPAGTTEVKTIKVQSDGKILVGGIAWTSLTGYAASNSRFMRLNSTGTLDTAFMTNTGTGPNNTVYDIAIQSDGKILVVGSFSTWAGTTVNRIVRLNADGTRDTAFTTNTGTAAGTATCYAVYVRSNGKIVVGGAFTSWNGTAINRIVQLNSDGTIDTAFTTAVGTALNTGYPQCFAEQPDGKLLAGCNSMASFNGVNSARLFRLNADNTLDTAFAANIGSGANDATNHIVVLPSGKLLVASYATLFGSPATSVRGVFRLNSDGSRDTDFTYHQNGGGYYGDVGAAGLWIAPKTDHSAVIVGESSKYGTSKRGGIVRISTDLS